QPPSWFPHSLSLANYRNLSNFDQGIGTYLTNSIVVAALTVAGSVVVCVLGGYGFARFTFRGKSVLFGATLAILMVPYATILLPRAVTVALFSFLTSWNEYLAPLIFLNDGSKYTLPVMLVNIRYASYNIIDFGALQAGVVVAMLPCLVLYLLLQRFYVSGLVA